MKLKNPFNPVLLLYPPPSDLTQSYSSLPALTGYLRSEGFRVIQRDLSIELMDEILSPENLSIMSKRANLRIKETGFLEDKEYLERFYKVSGISDYIITHVNEAKRVMHDEVQFYNLERYQWAVKLLHSACNLASLPYHPTILQPSHYETHFEPTVKGLLEITSLNDKKNLFYEIYEQKVLPQILRKKPLLVGISVTYDFQIIPAFTLSRLLKSAAPELHVCIGGAIIQRMDELLLNDSAVFEFADSFCVGEGETSLAILSETLLSGKELKSIPNLIVKKEGRSNSANLRWYEDVNKLPCPDFDGLPLDRYLSPEPVMLISSTRGCYYGKCAFCNVSMNTRRVYRQMEKNRLRTNIETLNKKHRANRFFFCDDAIPPVHMQSVANLVKEKLPQVTWSGEARFEKVLTPEFLVMLRAGGCRHLIFGLESASQRVLDKMNKNNSFENDVAVLNACSKSEIYVNLQTFIGFPTETQQEAWETINFLIENEHSISCFGFGCFELEKDTPVYHNPEHFGISKISNPKNPILKESYDYVSTIGMTMEDTEKVHEIALKKLGAIYSRRSTFIGGASGSHGLLQFSHFGYDEIYQLWKSMDKPKWTDNPNLSDLVIRVSPTLIFSHPPKLLESFEHLAFNTQTGKKFVLTPTENLLLELCDGTQTAGEIIFRWAEAQTQEQEIQIKLLGRGFAIIKEFLKKGILQAI